MKPFKNDFPRREYALDLNSIEVALLANLGFVVAVVYQYGNDVNSLRSGLTKIFHRVN